MSCRLTDRFLHYVGKYVCQPAWNGAPTDGHFATRSSEKVKSHVQRNATTWMTLRGPYYLLAEFRNNLRSCCPHSVVAVTHTSDGQPALHPFHRHLPCYQWRTQDFFRGGGRFNKFNWGQRGRGSGGGSPLVRGSGGSCNLEQEISFHIVKFS